MNERLKQLAEQAGFYYTDKTGFITPAGCDPAKFAELIVKECISAVEDTNDRHRRDYFAAKIKQHFGIQE
jgi:hypothetical protein